MSAILTLELRLEQDVVLARQRARKIAGLFGFEAQDQTRIATAVSEIARNAIQYAGGGRVEFSAEPGDPLLTIRISDRGPGIPDLSALLEGRFRSSTGMGIGVVGTRRLMDVFEIRSTSEGTVVTFGKRLSGPGPTQAELARIGGELVLHRPEGPLEEIQHQNQELLRTLEALRAQKAELAQVNRELEETNRGVVALYAELDERADYLQRANQIKTRFLSNMTHEFRTPLSSILSLSQVLLERIDGELSPEQEKQIRFMARSAEDLLELVNDLLDLAKVEAGKILVRPSRFQVADLFAALRGMLRPMLAQNSALSLIIEEPEPGLALHTDESKVSQILRNFISNALKYTERGEVRVEAVRGEGNTVVFSVADTGIGIALEDQDQIFEEFTQVDSPVQRRVRGTGLGLPLSRKLASLLGGSVRLRSAVGQGSTFSAIIPAEFKGPLEVSFIPEISRELDPTRMPVLVVEDNREALFVYEKFLKGSGFQALPARNLGEAREWLDRVRPRAIVLDVLLETETSWAFLTELQAAPRTHEIPVVVVTMVENEERAKTLGARAFHQKPVTREWLLGTLEEVTGGPERELILAIDDDEVSRYLLEGLLADTRFQVLEARTGLEGLALARERHPRAIFLDITMPGMDGFAVLEALREDAELREIPVIIYTAKILSNVERARLSHAVAVLSKESRSREAAVASVRAALGAAGLGGEGDHG